MAVTEANFDEDHEQHFDASIHSVDYSNASDLADLAPLQSPYVISGYSDGLTYDEKLALLPHNPEAPDLDWPPISRTEVVDGIRHLIRLVFDRG